MFSTVMFNPASDLKNKVKKMARTGVEPATLALLAPRSNQLS